MDPIENKPAASRTMPPYSVIPVLVYDDVGKAAAWLCNTFGFTERWRVANHRAQLVFGAGAVILGEGPVGQGSGPETTIGFQPMRHSLMVRVHNADQHYIHAKQHGARILQPPADYPYGERQYTVIDPGGHIWTFSQSIADLAPEDWGGTSAGPGNTTGTGTT